MKNGLIPLLPLFFVITAFAGTPPNSVYLTNNTKSSIKQPITISRVFADGEICNFPKPIDISEWQADVKTRWPSGCVQHALISFWSTTPAGATTAVSFSNSETPCHLGDQATCEAASLDQTGMLAFNSGNWGATIETTASGITKTVSVRDIISDGNFRYWLRGPIATQVIAEDRSPARVYDFGYSCTANCNKNFGLGASSVDPATDTFTINNHGLQDGHKFRVVCCAIAGGMDYNTDYYVVNSTANTFQVSKTRGGTPVDITTTGSYNGQFYSDGSDSTWTSDDKNRSLHPMFILTMYPGWAATKIDYILEDVWATALQDQFFNLTLKSGPDGATRYSFPNLTQFAQTRWRKTFWDGTAPVDLKLDLNFPYIIYSRVLPQYDLSLQPSNADVNSVINTFNKNSAGGQVPLSCQAINAQTTPLCGNWTMYQPTTGGRGDIALMPDWYLYYLYTWDPVLRQVIMTDADLSGIMPMHLRESAAGKMFDEAKSVKAQGRVLSVNARPTWAPVGGIYPSAADAITPVDYPSGLANMVPETAHHPDTAFVPYLITGDYFYLEELQFFGSWVTFGGNPSDANELCRHGDWGVVNNGQVRAQAWKTRALMHATFFSPDETPEKNFFRQKMEYTIAVFEGQADIQDGAFFDAACDANTFTAATASKWCWGRHVIGGTLYNPLHFFNRGTAEEVPGNNPKLTELGTSPWMVRFNYIVWGHGAELGYPFQALLRYAADELIPKIMDPSYSPIYLVGSYHEPTAFKKTDPVLAADLPPNSKSFTLAEAPEWFVAPALVQIDGERIRICSIAGNVVTVCDTGRGAMQTSTGAHKAGASVWMPAMMRSLADVRAAYADPNPKDFGNNDYAPEALGAVSFFSKMSGRGFEGTAAYARLKQLLGTPWIKWGMIPRRDPVDNVTVIPSDTSVAIRYTAPSAGQIDSACQVDGTDDGQRHLRARTFVKRGLEPGTTYTSTIHCEADHYNSGAGTGKTIVTYKTSTVAAANADRLQ